MQRTNYNISIEAKTRKTFIGFVSEIILPMLSIINRFTFWILEFRWNATSLSFSLSLCVCATFIWNGNEIPLGRYIRNVSSYIINPYLMLVYVCDGLTPVFSQTFVQFCALYSTQVAVPIHKTGFRVGWTEFDTRQNTSTTHTHMSS